MQQSKKSLINWQIFLINPISPPDKFSTKYTPMFKSNSQSKRNVKKYKTFSLILNLNLHFGHILIVIVVFIILIAIDPLYLLVTYVVSLIVAHWYVLNIGFVLFVGLKVVLVIPINVVVRQLGKEIVNNLRKRFLLCFRNLVNELSHKTSNIV